MQAQLEIIAPHLAVALRMWSLLELEPGETAVFTGGSPLSGLLGQVALWRGAAPVVCLGASEVTDRNIELVSSTDPRAAIERLSAIARNSPGMAVIDLTGQAETLEVLLESMPRWGRILLGAERSSRATVDFYNNVHRKGVRMIATRLDPRRDFGGDAAMAAEMLRAQRILSNQIMVDQLAVARTSTA